MANLELHPDIAAVIDLIPIGTIGADNLAEIRATPLAIPPELSDRVVRTEHRTDGDHAVPLRVHRATDAGGLAPCVFSIHGGGYVLGSYDMDDARFDAWCQRFGIVGVSVEYRLAPEHPYPTPLEDCYRGLAWTYEHAKRLGIDPNRIGIAGVSAGGGLAAALALLVRDRGELPISFQLLECPMIDDRQVTPSSRLDGLAIWNRDSNSFGWRSYLGDRYGADDIPAYAAPARATDLSGLPPAFVCVGAVDGFRDENIDYAMRLNQAGVPTELHVYPGGPHGVGLFQGTDLARQYQRDIEDWLARQLGR